jgi:hypothetical protein
MKEKLIKYLPYAIIIALALIYLQKCNTSNQEKADMYKAAKYAKDMSENNERTLTRTVNKQGERITSQEVLIATKETANELLLVENTRLKNIQSQVKVVTKTEIKNVYVPFSTDSTSVTNNDTIVRNKIFRVNNEWYGVSGKVLDKGIILDSISFKNKVTVVVGEQRNGLFKKNSLVVDVKNSSPYTSTAEVHNVVIVPNKKKWFETKGAAIGFGIVGGVLLSNQL